MQTSAAIIDSQSVRAADAFPKTSRGWDNGKKVNGRKRHIAVDALGLVLPVVVTPASVQDREAAKPLLRRIRAAHWLLGLVWADSGYTGKLVDWAATQLRLVVTIVRKHSDQHTFTVLPRRWVVEWTLAWISKHRRTPPHHHEAMVRPRSRSRSHTVRRSGCNRIRNRRVALVGQPVPVDPQPFDEPPRDVVADDRPVTTSRSG